MSVDHWNAETLYSLKVNFDSKILGIFYYVYTRLLLIFYTLFKITQIYVLVSLNEDVNVKTSLKMAWWKWPEVKSGIGHIYVVYLLHLVGLFMIHLILFISSLGCQMLAYYNCFCEQFPFCELSPLNYISISLLLGFFVGVFILFDWFVLFCLKQQCLYLNKSFKLYYCINNNVNNGLNEL